jgi:hypothetical protein
VNGIPELFVTNTLTGAILLALSIPLVKNAVKMNYIYGIRIEKALESEENWYKINNFAGKRLIFWSIILVCVGIFNYFINIDKNPVLFNIFALAPGIIIIPWIIEIHVFAKKL